MTDVSVTEPAFTVTVASPNIGSVSVTESTPSTVASVSESTFEVNVTQSPSPRVVAGDEIPTEYIKSITIGSGPLSVTVDADGDATLTHATPESNGVTYSLYPSTILVDATGHVRSVLGSDTSAGFRENIGIGAATVATRPDDEVLTTNNTSAFGRTFANAADASAARSTLSIGTVATYDYGDFALASHTHSASDITSGQLPLSQLPTVSDFVPYKQQFVSINGGEASTSTFSLLTDMYIHGARFDGSTP